MNATALSAVCYLNLARENEKDFLLYVDGLIDSLAVFWCGPQPLPLALIAPDDQLAFFRGAIAPVPGVQFRFLAEQELAPSLAADRVLVADRRDMVARLLYAAMAPTEFCLTLEPGVFCVRPFDANMLLPHGRARTEWEGRIKHPDWWRAAARLLDCEDGAEAAGLSVCPAILAKDLARHALDAVANANGHDPVKALSAATVGRKEQWTENTLYCLANEKRGLMERHWDRDVRPDDRPNRLHSDANLWSRADLRGWDPAAWRSLASHGYFLISNRRAGLEAERVLPTLYKLLNIHA